MMRGHVALYREPNVKVGFNLCTVLRVKLVLRELSCASLAQAMQLYNGTVVLRVTSITEVCSRHVFQQLEID